MDDNRKRRLCSAIILFSGIAILRSCNSNLNKENESEVKDTPAKIEQMTLEDNYKVVSDKELDEKIQKILDEKQYEVIEFTTENKSK